MYTHMIVVKYYVGTHSIARQKLAGEVKLQDLRRSNVVPD
jgi:hypothetical protein